jgi:Fe-S cluster biogenesis protein NfuA
VSGQRDPIGKILEEIIAPLVKIDGGELFLVAKDSEAIALHLAGTYAGCPGTTLTSSAIIEPAIRRVAPRMKVVITSGFQIPPGATRVEGRSRS